MFYQRLDTVRKEFIGRSGLIVRSFESPDDQLSRTRTTTRTITTCERNPWVIEGHAVKLWFYRMNQQSTELLRRLDERLELAESQLITFRRHFHQNPELSGHETGTTQFISQILAEADIPHRLAVNGCGIIGEIIRSPDPEAPVVALRADIDALPIQEENDVGYRSNNPGVMHACGHDAHTAMLLTTVLALKQENPFTILLAGHLPTFGRGRSRRATASTGRRAGKR